MNKIYNLKYILSAVFLILIMFVMNCRSYAEQNWLHEFTEICNKTDESATMKKEELRALIMRCDSLRTTIEKSDDPQKNVYLFRIDKCRKLFNYVLESNDK